MGKLKKLVDIKTLIIIGLIISIIFLTRGCNEKEIIEVPVKIEVPVPAKEGTSDTIYVPTPIEVEKENPLNQELLDKYNQARDSLDKLKVFEEAIKERDYKEKFEDSTQIITVHTKTQGKILEQSLNYHIKPYKLPLDTTIVINTPRKNKLFIGGEVGIPIDLNQDKVVGKLNLMLKNKKDNILSVGVDTEKRVWVGYAIKL